MTPDEFIADARAKGLTVTVNGVNEAALTSGNSPDAPKRKRRNPADPHFRPRRNGW